MKSFGRLEEMGQIQGTSKKSRSNVDFVQRFILFPFILLLLSLSLVLRQEGKKQCLSTTEAGGLMDLIVTRWDCSHLMTSISFSQKSQYISRCRRGSKKNLVQLSCLAFRVTEFQEYPVSFQLQKAMCPLKEYWGFLLVMLPLLFLSSIVKSTPSKEGVLTLTAMRQEFMRQ